MKRINYKSDIPPILLSLSVEGNSVRINESDFIVRFYIDGYEGRHYDCSHINGVWKNCEPSSDDTKLICYLDNQRLGIGALCAEFHYFRNDKSYSDGVQKTVVIIDSEEVGIELVEDSGDVVTESSIVVTLPFIYRNAYDIAVDHGYTGTAEDFYKALGNVVSIDHAESERKVAERNREQNEQERLENEDIRQANEQERKNSEQSRIKAEKIRNDNENLRIENEEDRKDSFANLVSDFNSFSAKVEADEKNRKANEQERLENEDARLTAESNRVSEEKMRQQMEIDRDTAEELRKAEENRRIENERQRIANEQNRESNLSKKADKEELYVALASMGFALDNVGGGSVAYVASVGDVYYDTDSEHIKYMAGEGDVRDLGEPSDKKVYCNAVSKLLYIWRGGAWVNVGGVDAYTKSESEERYAVKPTEGKVTALQKTVSENYADLGGRMGYAEDAIVQVGNDVKNLRADTASALEKKCDKEQYDAFKQTAAEKFDELDKTLEGKADLTNSEQVITAGGLDAVGAVRAQQGLFLKSGPASATQTKFEALDNGAGFTAHSTGENGEDASGYIVFNYPEENAALAITSANVEQSAGNSENFPMSQKAVTDALKTKQDLLSAGVGIRIADNVVSAREEVLYDDYFYPNKSKTTDTKRFTDSYEVLQPTAYVGDYTDADGVQWQYVWECEGFPDWFDYAEQYCHPYGNGVSTGVPYINNGYNVDDNGELYNSAFNVTNTTPCFPIGNDLPGIKKIDDTHFVIYQTKAIKNVFTSFNASTVDPSSFAFGSPCLIKYYNISGCRKIRIAISGQMYVFNKYDRNLCLWGTPFQLLNWTHGQCVFGTMVGEYEISEDATKYRQTRLSVSQFYRTTYTQVIGSLKEQFGDYIYNTSWANINNTPIGFATIDGKRVPCVATNNGNNPRGKIFLGSRLKITKLE